MEKIIAVVVMIAIVIGLIATAVMPYVTSMNNSAGEGVNDLNNITNQMTDGTLSGSQVIVELQSYNSKLSSSSEPISYIVIDNTNNTQGSTASYYISENSAYASSITGLKRKDGTTALSATKSDVAQLYGIISTSSSYEKTVTYYTSGNVKTILYTLAA